MTVGDKVYVDKEDVNMRMRDSGTQVKINRKSITRRLCLTSFSISTAIVGEPEFESSTEVGSGVAPPLNGFDVGTQVHFISSDDDGLAVVVTSLLVGGEVTIEVGSNESRISDGLGLGDSESSAMLSVRSSELDGDGVSLADLPPLVGEECPPLVGCLVTTLAVGRVANIEGVEVLPFVGT